MKIWEDDNQKYIKAMMEKNTTEQNEKLTKRLEEIDFSVLEHIERKETVNERGVFAPLDAVEVSEIEARGAEFKELGLKAIREGKVGAVLLAGGQGNRLGLDRPKGTLNIGVAKELYLFEQLLRNLMDVTDEAGVIRSGSRAGTCKCPTIIPPKPARMASLKGYSSTLSRRARL